MSNKDEFPLFYQRGENDSGQISFPISTDDFREFISSLLSRSDTLKGSHKGTFVFTKDFIANLDVSLRNRIESQNDLLYEDSSIKVYYDDDTVEEFSSVVRFESESCKKYVTCTGFACVWKYLIRFGAEPPQSQTITISAYGGGEETVRYPEHHKFDLEIEVPPEVEYVIQFTNRIWAREIESILRHDHIIPACQEKFWVEKLYDRFESYLSGIAGLFLTLLFIGFFIFGLFAFFRPNSISLQPLERVSQAEFDSQVNDLAGSTVEDRVDFIIAILEPALIEQGSPYSRSPRKWFFHIGGKILAFAIAILILLSVSGNYYFPEPRMFVLFNEKTSLKYKEFSKELKIRRRIVDFLVLSGAIGIGLGLFTNFLYDLISRGS